MGNQPTLRLLLTSVILAVAGCGQPSGRSIVDDTSAVTPQIITIYELADLLGLRIGESTQTHAELKNSANTVMIFTVRGGQVYVNGKSVGTVGKIKKTGGRVRVPKTLVALIRPALLKPASSGPLVKANSRSQCIVIDAGHGGKDPGAISVLGTYEKTINLAVAHKVARLLGERGFKVRMTRSDDNFIELEERAAIANRLRADLFVSIHADSFPKSSRRGYTMYVSRSASQASHQAAGSIARAMSQTGLGSHGTQTRDFRVLVRTRGPAVLVEMGYLTNRREAALLRSSSFQNRIAQAIADGITNYFG